MKQFKLKINIEEECVYKLNKMYRILIIKMEIIRNQKNKIQIIKKKKNN